MVPAVTQEPRKKNYELGEVDLRDTEQIPLTERGGIEAFLQREALPYSPDTWYPPDSVKVSYEVSLTRYFYKPQPIRNLKEIRVDILTMRTATEGLLGDVIGVGQR